MTFDINAIADVQTFTDDSRAEMEPRVYYFMGRKDSRTVGAFYAKQQHFGEIAMPAPWTEAERFDNEEGWEAPGLRLAVVAHRSQPFREEPQPNGITRRVWLNAYERGAKIYTELLCAMEGYEGLVVWPVKGMPGRAVSGKGGILSQASALLKKVETEYRKGVNRWLLWLPIGPAIDAKGKPVYTDTGFGSAFNLPALRVSPEQPVRDMLDELFVGGEIYRQLADVYEQVGRTWAAERRTNDAPPAEAEAAPSASYAPPADDDGYELGF